MSATVGLPSSVVIRDLMLTLWFNRGRIFLITIVAMAIATYAALQVQPIYQSNSSMLVLLGPEYALRPVANQQLTSSIRCACGTSRCTQNPTFLPALICTAALSSKSA